MFKQHHRVRPHVPAPDPQLEFVGPEWNSGGPPAIDGVAEDYLDLLCVINHVIRNGEFDYGRNYVLYGDVLLLRSALNVIGIPVWVDFAHDSALALVASKWRLHFSHRVAVVDPEPPLTKKPTEENERVRFKIAPFNMNISGPIKSTVLDLNFVQLYDPFDTYSKEAALLRLAADEPAEYIINPRYRK